MKTKDRHKDDDCLGRLERHVIVTIELVLELKLSSEDEDDRGEEEDVDEDDGDDGEGEEDQRLTVIHPTQFILIVDPAGDE